MDVKSVSHSTQILHPQRHFPSRQLRSSSPGEETALTAYCSAELHIVILLLNLPQFLPGDTYVFLQHCL